MQRGDWLFICRMEPVQFDQWLPEDDEVEGDYDFFSTFDGSCHSKIHCGLAPISANYASWFLERRIWEMFDKFQNTTVARNAMWIPQYEGRRDPHDPSAKPVLWSRLATDGIQYIYEKLEGKKSYKFVGLRYGQFFYKHTGPEQYNRKKHVWDVYRAYVKWAAESAGLQYEGV